MRWRIWWLQSCHSMSCNNFLFTEKHWMILQIKNSVVHFLFLSQSCVSYIFLININIYPLCHFLSLLLIYPITFNCNMLTFNIFYPNKLKLCGFLESDSVTFNWETHWTILSFTVFYIYKWHVEICMFLEDRNIVL